MFENSSNIKFRQRFKQEYESLKPPVQGEIQQAVEELAEEYQGRPWNHPQVQLIKDDRFETDKWIWRLKVMADEANHRIFFTWSQDDHKIVLLSVLHRNHAYQ